MSGSPFFGNGTAPTLGGLFSGIGGFELAWTMHGGRVAWMCEIDRKARKVLEARFPGVPIFEDVRDIDPDEVEPVDVLTGGSPCQGFSIAGHRTGLLHGESRLFADYIRILDGLADRGLQYAVWENVPGVLSIKNEDGERTFAHVVGALAGADAAVRLPEQQRWNAGVVARSGRAVAWRVVDSRHFGVPQRRRRVYATVAFGDSCDDRAGRAVLAATGGLSGNPPACVTQREDAAAAVDGRATGTSRPLIAYRKAGRARSSDDAESWTQDGLSNTLNVFDISSSRTTHAILDPYCLQGSVIGRAEKDGPEGKGWTQDASFALNLYDRHAVANRYGVRRLTPVECERLQAFPDGWTEPAGSDSARYRALGNAVTVTVPYWLFSRLSPTNGTV